MILIVGIIVQIIYIKLFKLHHTTKQGFRTKSIVFAVHWHSKTTLLECRNMRGNLIETQKIPKNSKSWTA